MSPQAQKFLPCGREAPASVQASCDSRAALAAMNARLEAFVARASLKRSEARRRVLEAVIEAFAEGARHFCAQDLIDRLQRRHRGEASRATVYRNLPLLVECGVLQAGPAVQDGEAYYELRGDIGPRGAQEAPDHANQSNPHDRHDHQDHHDHIVCLDCGTVFEFHDDVIERRQSRVVKDRGFTPREHRHVLYASCDRLSAAARSSSSQRPARPRRSRHLKGSIRS